MQFLLRYPIFSPTVNTVWGTQAHGIAVRCESVRPPTRGKENMPQDLFQATGKESDGLDLETKAGNG